MFLSAARAGTGKSGHGILLTSAGCGTEVT
jgi:hypothetical protein